MHMNKKTKHSIALILNIIVIIMEIYAETLQGFNTGFTRYLFYTIDSNLIALASSFVYVAFSLLRKEGFPAWAACLRYIAALNLVLTFLVVIFILCPMQGGIQMLVGGAFLYQHLFCPIITFISFVFLEEEYSLPSYSRKAALSLTLLYTFVLVIMNIIGIIVGPYPFLRVTVQPIWQSVLWFIALFAGFYFLANGLYMLANKFHTKKGTSL